LLVLSRSESGEYQCLARPARLATPGATVRVADGLQATVVGVSAVHRGGRVVTFDTPDADAAIERSGVAPLPPYIHTELRDPERYQTTYATGDPDSAAAPTAGLHFTPSVIGRLRDAGIGWATLRLDVGLGTFAPIRADRVEDHPMHEERYTLPLETAALIERTRAAGGRVVAVGTTVVRVLETCAESDGKLRAGSGATSLFIRPGHRFRAVDGLLTNFHQPRSSLLVLLAAFIGDERWRAAYAHALDAGYRFLSLGDCMLCWRAQT
jgi:S-adenosylmethionine:tRNA ribosyltransferase-isomerase